MNSPKHSFLFQAPIWFLFVALVFCFGISHAQNPTNSAQQAQALENTDLQSQNEFSPPAIEQNAADLDISTNRTWLKKFEKVEKRINKRQLKHPNRPIPVALMVFGFILLLLWFVLVLMTILAIASPAAFVSLLVLTIILSPLAILGIILIIGGIIGNAV
jgi:hypothetical protein